MRRTVGLHIVLLMTCAGSMAVLPRSAVAKKLKCNLCSDAKLARMVKGLRTPSATLEAEISGNAVTNAGLVHLKGLTNLKRLRLSCSMITDAGLKHLSGLTNLRRLNLASTMVTDAGMKYLRTLRNLEQLDLSIIYLTDAGLRPLGRLRKLKRLNLSYTRLKGVSLRHLRSLRKLRRLNLSNTSFKKVSLRHLRSLRKLEELDLAYVDLSDDGLKHLGRLRRLKRLVLASPSLKSCMMTDAGLMHLKRLTKLKSLTLRCNTLTWHGARKLAKALSSCHITLSRKSNTDNSGGLGAWNRGWATARKVVHHGKVRLKSLKIRGPRSRSSVRKCILRRLGRILHHYQIALATQPKLKGDLWVRFRINPTGYVTSVHGTSSNLHAPTLKKKVAETMRYCRFTKTSQGGMTVVVVTFRLLPTKH